MSLTPQQIAAKWQRNLASSTQAITEGVNSVTEAPTEKAAQRADAYLAGVNRAVADGRYQSGLRRVTLQDWKNSMTQKGIQRIATGASASEPKFAAFMTEFMPFLEQGVAAINRDTPRGDIEQNIARATAMMRHNAAFRRSA